MCSSDLYLKGLRRTEAIALGSRLLSQALREFGIALDEVKPEVQRAALGELGMKDLDELYEKIGLGERLIDSGLIGAECPAALQQQSDPLKRRALRHCLGSCDR